MSYHPYCTVLAPLDSKQHNNSFHAPINLLQHCFSMNSLYVYRALETPATIRLLELQPGTSDQPLQGRLFHVNLADYEGPCELSFRAKEWDEEPADFLDVEIRCWCDAGPGRHDLANAIVVPYYALSYVWGSSVFEERLESNEGSIAVTASLKMALQHVRLPHRVMYIWADQICINQQDLQERAHQVTLMGDIYRKTDHVLVWLGLDLDHQAHEIFRWIKQTSLDRKIVQLDDAERHPVEDIFRRCEWFSRLWVVQEVMLPRFGHVYWGSARIDLKPIIGILQNPYLRGERLFLEEHWLHRLSHAKLTQNGSRFIDMLAETKRQNCSDPHDRIYALLGLPVVEADYTSIVSKIIPSYLLPLEDLYYEVAFMLADAGFWPGLLLEVDHGPAVGSQIPGLPSWVPAWNNFRPINPSYDQPVQGEIPSMDEEQDLDQGTPVQSSWLGFLPYSVEPGTKCLTLRGLKVATIAEISECLTKFECITEFWYNHIRAFPLEAETSERPSPELALCDVVLNLSSFAPQTERALLFLEKCEVIGKDTLASGRNFTTEEMMFAAIRSAVQLDHSDFVKAASAKAATRPSNVFPGAFRYGCEHEIVDVLGYHIRNRRLLMLSNNYIGVAPEAARKDDFCVLIAGIDNPFILRPQNGYFEFVGAAHISGIMGSEVVKQCQTQGAGQLEDFNLR